MCVQWRLSWIIFTWWNKCAKLLLPPKFVWLWLITTPPSLLMWGPTVVVEHAFHKKFLRLLILSEQLRLFRRKRMLSFRHVTFHCRIYFYDCKHMRRGSNFYQSFFLSQCGISRGKEEKRDGKNEIWMNVNWIKMRECEIIDAHTARAVQLQWQKKAPKRCFASDKRCLLCKRRENLWNCSNQSARLKVN